MRSVLALAIMIMALLHPAVAQETNSPWQASITGQIEAFRARDGLAALDYAGAGFRKTFEGKPDAFYAAIIATGYQPIVDSRSHTFGEFTQVSPAIVVQVVNFVGPDQGLYQAIYQMADEPDLGWRVLGVALKKEAGLGI